MWKKQREFWAMLTWFEWVMVTTTCIPGVVVFKMYLKVFVEVATLLIKLQIGG